MNINFIRAINFTLWGLVSGLSPIGNFHKGGRKEAMVESIRTAAPSLLELAKSERYRHMLQYISQTPPRLFFQAIRCTTPSCGCECFLPSKTCLRSCDTCKHGWVAHGEYWYALWRNLKCNGHLHEYLPEYFIHNQALKYCVFRVIEPYMQIYSPLGGS